ncbi:hypothetical protein PsAD5_02636 [Pseudovibrio sp. Ad5]|uniref:hypothetical protein n=1 Tax=Pseudovibrio sp. Alg231-02 TaxID=1922223 RepID=UPI0007B2987F|nr:hypothetical protein [Pseudovibrio sp. Alg231-02]KZK96443.1 hypothetical protein PsAD5_02636 [Pseudovibrio sp. Ad5]
MNVVSRLFSSSTWKVVVVLAICLPILFFLVVRLFSEDTATKYTIDSVRKVEQFYSLQAKVKADLNTYRRITGKNFVDVTLDACVVQISNHFNNGCRNIHQNRGEQTTINLREVGNITLHNYKLEFNYNERTRKLRDQTGDLIEKLYKHYRTKQIEKINRERLHTKRDDNEFIDRLYDEVEEFVEQKDLRSFSFLHHCQGRSSLIPDPSYYDYYLLRYDAPKSVWNKLLQYHEFCLRNSEADIARYAQ